MDSTSWAALFDRFVGPPMVIVGIALGAIVVRWLLHRLIKRIVRTATCLLYTSLLSRWSSAGP